MTKPFGDQGLAATVRQQCPQMTLRFCPQMTLIAVLSSNINTVSPSFLLSGRQCDYDQDFQIWRMSDADGLSTGFSRLIEQGWIFESCPSRSHLRYLAFMRCIILISYISQSDKYLLEISPGATPMANCTRVPLIRQSLWLGNLSLLCIASIHCYDASYQFLLLSVYRSKICTL